MPPASLFGRLAVQHLRRRPVRALLLAAAVAVGGATAFSSAVLRSSIQDSMEVSLDRLGADLMVVPQETAVNLAAALLTVEPSPHTLDPATAARIAALPGVHSAAPQRYFTLPTSGKAHDDIELIAFDPARDFTILPWLTEKLDRPLRRGDVIIGARRDESVGSQVMLSGQPQVVYGKLALTGVGPFERAIFVSFDAAADIAAAVKAATGRDILAPGPERASALLIRLDVGTAPERFRFAAAPIAGVQVIAGNGLNTTVRQGMQIVLNGTILFTVLSLLTIALMVGILYSGLLAERRRELGLLLAIGLRPGQLVRVILAEAALTTGLGGVCGVVLAAAVLMLCQRSLGYSLAEHQVPFTLPALPNLAATGALSVLICALVGLAGALLPAWRVGRSEPYELVRGEGA